MYTDLSPYFCLVDVDALNCKTMGYERLDTCSKATEMLEKGVFQEDGQRLMVSFTLLSWSYHSNSSLVEKTNVEYMWDKFSHFRLWKAYNTLGGETLLFDVEMLEKETYSDEIMDCLDALEDYHILDEDLHNQKEQELIDGEYDSFVKDYRKALRKKFPLFADEIIYEYDMEFEKLLRDMEEKMDISPYVDALYPYLDVEWIAKQTTLKDLEFIPKAKIQCLQEALQKLIRLSHKGYKNHKAQSVLNERIKDLMETA